MTRFFRNNPPANLSEINNQEEVKNNKLIKKQKMEQSLLKYELRDLIKESSLNIRDENTKELFDKINVYLGFHSELNMEGYEFDDTQTENLYKSIKRLRMDKKFYDRVGFMAFNFIFNEDLAEQSSVFSTLWFMFLERFQLSEFKNVETILNLAYFCFDKGLDYDFSEEIPTILKNFLDEECLTEEFLIKWG